mgnify:CR=1 FL=1
MTADLPGGTAAPAGTDPLAALRAAARARTEQRESAKAAHHAERARQAAQGREKRSTDELREIARRGAERLDGVGTRGGEGAPGPAAGRSRGPARECRAPAASGPRCSGSAGG